MSELSLADQLRAVAVAIRRTHPSASDVVLRAETALRAASDGAEPRPDKLSQAEYDALVRDAMLWRIRDAAPAAPAAPSATPFARITAMTEWPPAEPSADNKRWIGPDGHLPDGTLAADPAGDLCADIAAFLADAPKGKPHEGYRYGELLAQAAATIKALQEDLDQAHDGRTKEATARIAAEARERELVAIIKQSRPHVARCEIYPGAVRECLNTIDTAIDAARNQEGKPPFAATGEFTLPPDANCVHEIGCRKCGVPITISIVGGGGPGV